jgi:hypothetical protein
MNRHLRRTRANVGPLVLLFCADVAARTQHRVFSLFQLEQHIMGCTSATPGTAGRVLRQLRAQGAVDYRARNGLCYLRRVDPSAVEDAARQRELFRDETSGPAR